MKKQYFFGFLAFIFGLLKINTSIYANMDAGNYLTLTEDGAWCWFADPRAVYYKGEKEQTYFGWVNSQGDIVVASYNHETKESQEKIIHAKLEIDDHDVPALFIREDGHIIVFYSKHQSAGPMQRVISTNPEDISSFSSSYTWGTNVSYPNPFQVGDSICLLYRGINWHPTIAVSTDDGKTFPDVKQLILNGGARPYARYCQSQDGSIHIAVTTGHPRNESKNQIFYFKLKNNHFYRADGTLIKEFTEGIDLGGNGNNTGVGSEAEIVYDGKSNGKGWIWDITIDPETQHPVLVYASFPTDSDHRYNYAYWNGTEWVNKEIVKAGKWFPQTPSGKTEDEKNYSGGLSLHHENPAIVYLSKQVNGVFEIYKYETKDKGETWIETAITKNTPPDIVNARPIVPRNHKEGYFDVLWMRGKYTTYQNYKTALVFQMKNTIEEVEKIELNHSELSLTIGDKEILKPTFSPLISISNLTWDSSDEEVAIVEEGIVTALSPGTAEIKVQTVNGKKAVCTIIVKDRDYLTKAFFDFGTSSSPVVRGAVRVTGSTLLKDKEDTYGWLSAVESKDRGSSFGSEKRDFNMSSTNALFKVYITKGNYDVTITQGDGGNGAYPHGKMSVKLNGITVVDNISVKAGEFNVAHFNTTIEKNEMVFEFSTDRSVDENWVVNSIKIEPVLTSIQNVSIEEEFINPHTEITIFDVAGNKIIHCLLGNKDYATFLKDQKLLKGIYIQHLRNNNKVSVKKISL